MPHRDEIQLKQGVFTLSLDFELIWGTQDLFGPERFRGACERERAAVVRLLDLFAEFEMSATWCIVGHLFLDHCAAENGCKHPEIVRAKHAWYPNDWFARDPGGSEATEPIFFARSLIQKIRDCPTPQEIGCHSFSHVIFGDPGCSREAADSELSACVRLAQDMGIELRSFAFPRNRVGHLDVLAAHGFTCYRSPDPNWYERGHWPNAVKRLAHLWDVLTAARPPVGLPTRTSDGLCDLPGSMILFPMHGLRRFVPNFLRVRRAVRGLDEAVRRKRIFHLWFHPTNLADGTEAMFASLRQILQHAAALRRAGDLEFSPMGAVALAGV